jgi:hypothetical protein
MDGDSKTKASLGCPEDSCECQKKEAIRVGKISELCLSD